MHNKLVYLYNENESELNWLKMKMTNLKDRSRCCNIKLRGAMRSILTSDLVLYLKRLL